MSMSVRKRKHAIIFSISMLILCLCITGCSAKPLPTEQADGIIINVPVTGNMTIVRYFVDPDTIPDTTAENVPSIEIIPSEDDEKKILAILNDKKYISESPACLSDLLISNDNYSFYIHTTCGSIITTIDNSTISSVLSDDELEELLTICDAL